MDTAEQTASPFGEHQLAAIVFTDVVDYSAQMARDAAGTLQAVEADFKRLRQLCARYRGTVHNTMGDGMLMSFQSATHAVVYALRVQKEFDARNRANPQALRHRIGIHIGELMLGADGVAGDGVNIAARILPLASPGGACLSETVHRAVKSQLLLKVEPIGTPPLKNISEPIPVCLLDIQASRLPMHTRLSTFPLPWGIAAGGLLLLFLVGIGTWRWLATRRPETTPAPVPPAAARPASDQIAPKSLAVLPFVDLSPAHDQELLGDGIADELINTLSRLPDVRVAARSSAFAFKGRNVGAIEVGRELKVARILEGTVRKIDSHVRVAVRLTNAADGYQLWSETFDREPKDLLALQIEIARNIAQKLQLTFDANARDKIERLATDSPEAYEAYLRGRQILNRRGTDISEAQRHFESAMAADPYFSLAFSGAAECHALRAFQGWIPAGEEMPRALAAAERARELEPDLAAPYATIGFVRLFFEWDTRAAEEMFQRATHLSRDHAGALSWGAVARLNRGDPEGAVAMAVRATEAEPMSPVANALRGWVLLLARQPAEAKAWLEKARTLDANYSFAYALLCEQAEAAGDLTAALAACEAGLQRSPTNASLLAHAARAKALAGRTAEAQAVLQGLTERSRGNYVRGFLFALAYSGFGESEKEAVLNALERAVTERDSGIAVLRHMGQFDALRQQPRFQQIEKTVGAKLWFGRAAR